MSHFITEWYFFLPGYQEVVLSVDRFCSPVQPVLTSLSSVFKALESFSVLGSDMKTLFLELYSSFGYFAEGISAFLLDVAQLCCQFVHCFVSLQTLTLIDWVLLGNDLIWNQVFRGWNKRDRRRWFPAAGSVFSCRFIQWCCCSIWTFSNLLCVKLPVSRRLLHMILSRW